jgi:hypothetical protein
MVCHSRAANFVLGLTELQMNKVHDYGGIQSNQLRTLEHLGVLRVNAADEMKQAMREECKKKGMTDKQINEYMEKQTATRNQREAKVSSLLTFAPEKYRHLPDPYDRKADLNLRARAYLHSNCAQCHVEAGGGNAAFSVEFDTAADKMNLFDEKPKHHTFDLPDARLIAPGKPDSSVLLHRMANRKAGHMPPLATAIVDDEAVRMLREWIREMKPLPKGTGRKE